MLLGTFAASILGNASSGRRVTRAGEMLPHPLTNFEIQKYCQNEPKFNGVYSRNNWSKVNEEAYILILMSMNQKELIGLLSIWMLKM